VVESDLGQQREEEEKTCQAGADTAASGQAQDAAVGDRWGFDP
jgi:hypothetical protein